MAREIVLDTETTGFEPSMGHRMVEIACLEIDDFVPTGRSFHTYIDPCRDMPADAERVHGLSGAFLKGKPRFEHPQVVDAFLDFVGDAPLIAHNAGFDRAFINHELGTINRHPLHEDRWIDTLALADAKLLAAVYLELKGGRERRLELKTEAMVSAAVTANRATYGERPRPLA